jgi:hypothetical protein
VGRDSRKHVSMVNDLQQKERYYFKFPSPLSFGLFSKALRNGAYKDFRS